MCDRTEGAAGHGTRFRGQHVHHPYTFHHDGAARLTPVERMNKVMNNISSTRDVETLATVLNSINTRN